MGEDFADISPSPIFGLLLSETFPVLIAYLCQYLSKHVWDLSGVYWIVIPMIIFLNYLDHVCQEEMCPRLLRLQNWKSQKKGIIGIKQNWKSRKKGCRHGRHLFPIIGITEVEKRWKERMQTPEALVPREVCRECAGMCFWLYCKPTSSSSTDYCKATSSSSTGCCKATSSSSADYCEGKWPYLKMWWAAPHTNTSREFLRRCVPAGQVPQHTFKSFGESEYMFQLTCRKQSMIQLNCRKQHCHRQGHFLWKLMMWCCSNHHIISFNTKCPINIANMLLDRTLSSDTYLVKSC